MKIRQEREKDHAAVEGLVEAAFRDVPYSDRREHELVARLRRSRAFVPELSLVAEVEGELVGHILCTRIRIKGVEREVQSLALAPVSVLPDFQGQGIGGALILAAHAVARNLGFGSVILLGHEKYYPRFGYEKASGFGIEIPFEAPDENVMAIELRENALENAAGMVEYPPEFMN